MSGPGKSLWQKLLAPFREALVSHVAGSAIQHALGVVVEMHSAELRVLLRIESQINALVNGPFQSGVTWLGEAVKPQRTPTERKSNLRDALAKFVDAQAQQGGFDRAVAQLHVGLCYTLLKQPVDGREWMERAYGTADAALIAAFYEADANANRWWRLFGGGRITREFLSTMHRHNEFLSALGSVLDPSPDGTQRPQWRSEYHEWSEWVGAFEPGESPWAERRAIFVHRGEKILGSLPAPD